VMGSDSPWRFFSLPNAWSAGFIPQSEIIDWGGRNGVWVLMDRRRRAPTTIGPSPKPSPKPGLNTQPQLQP
jgi:hypothetical protein